MKAFRKITDSTNGGGGMSMQLFEHNQTAYNAVVVMLAETGKAAVIHPTGTGKSFIGFKLCEDNPDKKILWLSPSDYIFKTQLENLAAVSDGWKPENITFATYQKISMYSNEIDQFEFDYLILDEFHRCGGEVWSININKILSKFPGMRVLGLSATAIRYLDNQRNMADELFDGNIASEMTLGEALVRGIIRAPKYVLGMYSFQSDLEKYERKMRNVKQKITYDCGKDYLEKLRKMLQNAVGIGDIFKKHITSINSKFIVFCSRYDHMLDMIEKCKSWFYDIDNAPHIYYVYSIASDSDQQFKDFKMDNDPVHLKLLFCIDSLNEGIHVENISGVILLRPTISPIVFKQQIGRALTTADSSVPLIFDIVDNIENLYSIGTLQEEVRQARCFYESTGRSDMIVNDTFKIIDEVADVKKMFAQLDDVLSASWDQMYKLAVDYYESHGQSIEMPVGTVYKGYPLSNWIITQRAVFKGRTNGILDEEHRRKLEQIGMRWDSMVDENFAVVYPSAKRYYQEHGNLLVPNTYVDENGVRLGSYIHYLRESERKGRRSFLNNEQRKMLTEIGMDWTWSKERSWEENYKLLEDYLLKNPNKPIPIDLKTVTGGSLRNWKSTQVGAYRRGKLSSDKIAKLEQLGIYFAATDKWMAAYSYASKFYEKHHHMNFPNNCTVNGVWMKLWWDRQLDAYFGRSKRKLTCEQIELLEALNIQNHKNVAERRWFECYETLKAYFQKNGNIAVPSEFTAVNGVNVRTWINSQRAKRKKNKLSNEKFVLLNEIGMVWNIDLFQEGLMHAEAYITEHGDLRVCSSYVCDDGYELGEFLRRMRRRRNSDKLSPEQIECLNAVGMIWNAQDERFYASLEDCRQFYEEHGHLRIPLETIGNSGVKLSYWLTDCRRKLRQKKFSEDKVALLREAHITIDETASEDRMITVSKTFIKSSRTVIDSAANG